MILVTHTTNATLARDTFVFATSARLEGSALVLRDPLKRTVASFDAVNVVAVHKREGNGPQMVIPLGQPIRRPDFRDTETMPAVFQAAGGPL